MRDESGKGHTRTDKTLTRMAQERASPGVTTAGGNETALPSPKATKDPTLSVAGDDLNSSDNSASRRGDINAETGGVEPDPRGPDTPSRDGVPSMERPVNESRMREDRVREAAYLRFLARGGVGGDATSDWLDAEADIASNQK